MPLLKMDRKGNITSFGFDQESMGAFYDPLVDVASSVVNFVGSSATWAAAQALNAAQSAADAIAAATHTQELLKNPIVQTVVKTTGIPQVIQVVKQPSMSNIIGAVTEYSVNAVADPTGLLRIGTGGVVDPGAIAASQVTIPQGGVAKVDDTQKVGPTYVEQVEYRDENGNLLTQEEAEARMAAAANPQPQYVDENGNILTQEQVDAYYAAQAQAQAQAAMEPGQTAAPIITTDTTSTIVSSGTPLKEAEPIVAAPVAATLNYTKHPMEVYNLA